MSSRHGKKHITKVIWCDINTLAKPISKVKFPKVPQKAEHAQLNHGDVKQAKRPYQC